MIQSLKLLSSELSGNSKYRYLNESKNAQLKSLLMEGITFNKGINILVGENGSGKTTILNIIRDYTLCNNNWHTTWKTNSVGIPSNIESLATKVLDDFDLKADFYLPSFNLRKLDYNNSQKVELLSRRDFQQHLEMAEHSTGENVLGDINQLWAYMFDPKLPDSPVACMTEWNGSKNGHNDAYSESAKKCIDYFNKHDLNLKDIQISADRQVTVFMDEPDSGLALKGIKSLYEIFSHEREDTQIIVPIHNIALIQKLKSLSFINFIEVSGDYLREIDSFTL